MGQKRRDQLLLRCLAGLGLEHQAHRRVLAGLVAHHVQHGQDAGLELCLVLAQRLFAGLDLGVGDFFDFFEHALCAHAGRELVDHKLPLATGQFFDLPARTHLQAATARAVGVGNIARAADDLAATGVVRAGHQRQQVFGAERGRLDERNAGVGNLAQVVAGYLGGQAHGNAAGAVEQRKRQACGQLAGFLRAAVVVGHEIDRAFIDLVEQQAGDARQARLGIAHGRSAIAVTAAEVALAVNQRVPLGKVLRHAHQRVVGRLVAVRVKTAQHIAHHAGTLDGLGRRAARGAAVAQAHAVHRIQNAPLHGLEAIAHVGQCTALDDRQSIFKIGALGITGQIQGVAPVAGGSEIESGLVAHSFGFGSVTFWGGATRVAGRLPRFKAPPDSSMRTRPGPARCASTGAGGLSWAYRPSTVRT